MLEYERISPVLSIHLLAQAAWWWVVSTGASQLERFLFKSQLSLWTLYRVTLIHCIDFSPGTTTFLLSLKTYMFYHSELS